MIYVLSLAYVKKVFSQLKLCLSAQKARMLLDEIETSLILRVMDVPGKKNISSIFNCSITSNV